MKIHREKTILDVLYRKQAFLDNEMTGFKNPQIGIFPKGLVHDFGKKVEVIVMFCVHQKYIGKKCLLTV